jgi:ornithine carbamoyltransferase
MSTLRGRDFITLTDYSASEIDSLLRLARAMKTRETNGRPLDGKQIGMLFAVPSTRTRISFQVGAAQLGAHAEHYGSGDLQIANHESLPDTAAVMSRFLDAIVVRLYDMQRYGFGRQSLETLAARAAIPVVNALDDKDHPCQVLADLLTLREKFGDDLPNKTIVLTWAYAKRQKSPGVPHSMLTAAALLGLRLRIAHPVDFDLDPAYVSFARQAAVTSGATIEFSNDLREASAGADVIYTKSWKSLTLSHEDDLRRREEVRDDWCVNADHMRAANPGACFMDCMPFIRGESVTAEVADGPQSIIYDQAENRLHVQKAVLASIV